MITDTPREKELETRDEQFLAEVKDKRIAVLLSGGVDSSVVVWEFARLGLHPDCFYIKIGPEEKEEWDCSSEEDLEMATAVARKYGCKLEVVDCHQEYWNEVTRYTMDKVKAGFTPNPDVMCNRLIKFGAFDEKMGHNYDLIASGHYAQTETDENGDKWLVTSPDPVKDQTDFLAQIESWQLKKAIFPIGADLITLCSILRIPVCMHNVEEDKIFRPASWNAFGMDKEGADFRACKNYGPIYK
mgnify:CR=1 FL=1